MANDKSKLIAMALLKLGHTPREVADKTNISYTTVVKLLKELGEAETKGTILQLFDLDKLSFDNLMQSAQAEIEGLLTVVSGSDVVIENILPSRISGLQVLEVEFQDSAKKIAHKIGLLASITTDASELAVLSDALSRLQTSFFAKGTNITVNTMNGDVNEYLAD